MSDLKDLLPRVSASIVDGLSAYTDPQKREELAEFATDSAALIAEAVEAGRPDLVEGVRDQMRMRLESERIMLHSAKWDAVSGVIHGVVGTSFRLLLGLGI